MTGNGPVTWVGVAGFEPAASSSRTKDEPQASGTASLLACEVIPQHPPASPNGARAPDAWLTHAASAAAGDVIAAAWVAPD